VNKAATILRDQRGVNDKFVGYGNSKTLNQLIAHHGILFKPEKREMWISTPPYQLGEFIYYNLNDVFSRNGTFQPVDSLKIRSDPFLASNDYKKFEAFKVTKQKISKYVMLGVPFDLSREEEVAFVANNPESFLPYLFLGDYFKMKKNFKKAISYYREALKRDVASLHERNVIKDKIAESQKVSFLIFSYKPDSNDL